MPIKKTWEDVLRRINARQMPPADKKKRPTESEYNSTIATLENVLDNYALQHPNPGIANTIRRMNRTEYRNAVRDLLAVDMDVTDLIPAEELSHGFDDEKVEGLNGSHELVVLMDAKQVGAFTVSKTVKVKRRKHGISGDERVV